MVERGSGGGGGGRFVSSGELFARVTYNRGVGTPNTGKSLPDNYPVNRSDGTRITDIDKPVDGYLIEEKSMFALHPDDYERWMSKEVDRKLDRYLEARTYLDPEWANAPIGIRFTHKITDLDLIDALEARVHAWANRHPGVEVILEFSKV
jgi:hypothetical protein